ncbi:uncharacterized protein LOC102628784 [Citrus sinensis]|uniref:uncharacterized protein LOC102628784 n=1 Tax=Citrus sinensis TaxID=2711 RepID=UPI0022796A99|nr:uncharacterized protein LOC102628784 [Citrus sinensis]
MTVKGNGIDASDVCIMCKREIGNGDSEGSKQPCFRYNSAATESEQSFCDPKKHPLRQYRASPFVVPMSLQSKEIMLLEYIMNEDLDKWETLVTTKNNCLSRNTILSLAPRRVIRTEIISTLSEMLNDFQLLNGTNEGGYWFLPVLDAETMAGDDPLLEMWLRNIVSNDRGYIQLGSCDRIIVPICNGIGHWYLLVVVIPEMRAEIWDPLASCMTTNLFLMEVHHILKCFDVVLNRQRPSLHCGGFPFLSCEVSHPSLNPKDLHPFDCGLYVFVLMKQLHYRQRPLTEIELNSDAERLSLILQLVHFRDNLVKERVMENARLYRSNKEAFAEVREGEITKQQRLFKI